MTDANGNGKWRTRLYDLALVILIGLGSWNLKTSIENKVAIAEMKIEFSGHLNAEGIQFSQRPTWYDMTMSENGLKIEILKEVRKNYVRK